MTLTTERLTLRAPVPADVPVIAAFYRSERSAMAGGHLPPHRAWMQAAAILGHWQVRGFGLWAVVRRDAPGDAILGLVGPFHPDGWPDTEIGWVLFDGAEGHGFAQEAATAALADARDRLGWTRIVSYIDPANARSIALAERMGARLDPSATPPRTSGPTTPGKTPVRVYLHPAPAEAAR